MVDVLLSATLEGVNTKHFKSWFTSCAAATVLNKSGICSIAVTGSQALPGNE
jgi:hypothetical protein